MAIKWKWVAEVAPERGLYCLTRGLSGRRGGWPDDNGFHENEESWEAEQWVYFDDVHTLDGLEKPPLGPKPVFAQFCEDCDYAHYAQGNDGLCLHSPEPVMKKLNDWCGKWKPRTHTR